MKADFIFGFLVLVTAAVVGLSWWKGAPSSKDVVASRTLRTVNVEEVLRLIQEGKLSDKEALFYEPAEE